MQVNGGSGSGIYAADSPVEIQAYGQSGYTFDHWQVVSENITLENPESAKTTFVMPDEAVELTAVYVTDSGSSGHSGSSGSSSPSGDYLVSTDRAAGGKVTVNPGRADRGDTVTITVKPDSGYVLDELTVTEKNGGRVQLTQTGDNKYTFTMPGGGVEVTASFVKQTKLPTDPFADVYERDYYYQAVLWAAQTGVTGGIGADTFGPHAPVTRAQMVTFLWRAHGSPKAAVRNPFLDVSADDYYYDAALWAAANGVTSGTSADRFSPDAPVTRAQAVTFQWRAAGSPMVSGDRFSDVTADAYYAAAVSWAVANGITSGTGGDTFSPEAVVSRAQAVTFLYREQE